MYAVTFVSDVDPDMHDFQCPCEAGLECRGTVVHHYNTSHVHENPICQKLETIEN